MNSGFMGMFLSIIDLIFPNRCHFCKELLKKDAVFAMNVRMISNLSQNGTAGDVVHRYLSIQESRKITVPNVKI